MTDEPKPLTEEELERILAHYRINTSGNPPIAQDMLLRDVPRLVVEIRRLRDLLNTASSYLVDHDAHCQACDRPIISGDHAPECDVGRIIAEFGSEDA